MFLVIFSIVYLIGYLIVWSKEQTVGAKDFWRFVMLLMFIFVLFIAFMMSFSFMEAKKKLEGKCPELEKVENVYRIK